MKVLSADHDLSNRELLTREDSLEFGDATKALEERALLAELSAEIVTALARQESLPARLQLCTDTVVRHLQAAFAEIWILDEKENVLKLEASAGCSSEGDHRVARVTLGSQEISQIAG